MKAEDVVERVISMLEQSFQQRVFVCRPYEGVDNNLYIQFRLSDTNMAVTRPVAAFSEDNLQDMVDGMRLEMIAIQNTADHDQDDEKEHVVAMWMLHAMLHDTQLSWGTKAVTWFRFTSFWNNQSPEAYLRLATTSSKGGYEEIQAYEHKDPTMTFAFRDKNVPTCMHIHHLPVLSYAGREMHVIQDNTLSWTCKGMLLFDIIHDDTITLTELVERATDCEKDVLNAIEELRSAGYDIPLQTD